MSAMTWGAGGLERMSHTPSTVRACNILHFYDSPLDKDELVTGTLSWELVLEVVDGPSALLLGKLGDELLKVA